jgi:hypothetical protein
MRGAPARAAEDEEVLRVAERREASDQIGGDDLQHHGVLDVEVRDAAGDDGEGDDDEERDVVGHQRGQHAGERDQRERETARGGEAIDRAVHDDVEITRRAQDLDRHQQREKDQQEVEVDGARRGARRHAAGEEKQCRDERGTEGDDVRAKAVNQAGVGYKRSAAPRRRLAARFTTTAERPHSIFTTSCWSWPLPYPPARRRRTSRPKRCR